MSNNTGRTTDGQHTVRKNGGRDPSTKGDRLYRKHTEDNKAIKIAFERALQQQNIKRGSSTDT